MCEISDRERRDIQAALDNQRITEAGLRKRLTEMQEELVREFESGSDWCQRALAAEAELAALQGRTDS